MFSHERQFRESFQNFGDESPKKNNFNFKTVNPTPNGVRAKIEIWFHSLVSLLVII